MLILLSEFEIYQKVFQYTFSELKSPVDSAYRLVTLGELVINTLTKDY